MLRDENLIPLSRQHQHALALCVRIDRASPISDGDLAVWQAEIAQHFLNEIRVHFSAEERILFPAARKFQELMPLIENLLTDHAALRELFASAETGNLTAADLSAFGVRMSAHIRKEERQLFERLQDLLSQEELSLLGDDLEQSLKESEQECILPNDATRLRAER